jgi:hypothetical protein
MYKEDRENDVFLRLQMKKARNNMVPLKRVKAHASQEWHKEPSSSIPKMQDSSRFGKDTMKEVESERKTSKLSTHLPYNTLWKQRLLLSRDRNPTTILSQKKRRMRESIPTNQPIQLNSIRKGVVSEELLMASFQSALFGEDIVDVPPSINDQKSCYEFNPQNVDDSLSRVDSIQATLNSSVCGLETTNFVTRSPEASTDDKRVTAISNTTSSKSRILEDSWVLSSPGDHYLRSSRISMTSEKKSQPTLSDLDISSTPGIIIVSDLDTTRSTLREQHVDSIEIPTHKKNIATTANAENDFQGTFFHVKGNSLHDTTMDSYFSASETTHSDIERINHLISSKGGPFGYICDLLQPNNLSIPNEVIRRESMEMYDHISQNSRLEADMLGTGCHSLASNPSYDPVEILREAPWSSSMVSYIPEEFEGDDHWSSNTNTSLSRELTHPSSLDVSTFDSKKHYGSDTTLSPIIPVHLSSSSLSSLSSTFDYATKRRRDLEQIQRIGQLLASLSEPIGVSKAPDSSNVFLVDTDRSSIAMNDSKKNEANLMVVSFNRSDDFIETTGLISTTSMGDDSIQKEVVPSVKISSPLMTPYKHPENDDRSSFHSSMMDHPNFSHQSFINHEKTGNSSVDNRDNPHETHKKDEDDQDTIWASYLSDFNDAIDMASLGFSTRHGNSLLRTDLHEYPNQLEKTSPSRSDKNIAVPHQAFMNETQKKVFCPSMVNQPAMTSEVSPSTVDHLNHGLYRRLQDSTSETIMVHSKDPKTWTVPEFGWYHQSILEVETNYSGEILDMNPVLRVTPSSTPLIPKFMDESNSSTKVQSCSNELEIRQVESIIIDQPLQQPPSSQPMTPSIHSCFLDKNDEYDNNLLNPSRIAKSPEDISKDNDIQIDSSKESKVDMLFKLNLEETTNEPKDSNRNSTSVSTHQDGNRCSTLTIPLRKEYTHTCNNCIQPPIIDEYSLGCSISYVQEIVALNTSSVIEQTRNIPTSQYFPKQYDALEPLDDGFSHHTMTINSSITTIPSQSVQSPLSYYHNVSDVEIVTPTAKTSSPCRNIKWENQSILENIYLSDDSFENLQNICYDGSHSTPSKDKRQHDYCMVALPCAIDSPKFSWTETGNENPLLNREPMNLIHSFDNTHVIRTRMNTFGRLLNQPPLRESVQNHNTQLLITEWVYSLPLEGKEKTTGLLPWSQNQPEPAHDIAIKTMTEFASPLENIVFSRSPLISLTDIGTDRPEICVDLGPPDEKLTSFEIFDSHE